ncbi:MAG: FAD-dependent oxidoreductase, partial [Candidatus Altiarchaeales archaeon]|nr:FAD-dependent oxidoreductase [Candidatus Altiarchaeales archaeon]
MKVVVLGGGLAGLSTGWVLSKNGIDVTVLEKEDSVGGLARSFKRNGYTYDLGGHRFFTKNNQLVDVIKDILGDNLLVMPRNSSIYMQGRF